MDKNASTTGVKTERSQAEEATYRPVTKEEVNRLYTLFFGLTVGTVAAVLILLYQIGQDFLKDKDLYLQNNQIMSQMYTALDSMKDKLHEQDLLIVELNAKIQDQP